MNKRLIIISMVSVIVLSNAHINIGQEKPIVNASLTQTKRITVTTIPKMGAIKQAPAQTTIAPRKTGIDKYIEDSAVETQLPEKFIRAIISAESDFNPTCIGPDTKYGNAFGLMQLLPSTAKEVGIGNLFDPQQNIEGGSRYLKQLYDRYSDKDYFDQNGEILTPYELAAIAYNWGYTNLNNHIKKYGFIVIAENSKYAIPKETYNYINKIHVNFDFNQYFD